MKIEIPDDDIDPVGRRIRVDGLQLPYSSVDALYLNSSKIDKDNYSVKGSYIALSNIDIKKNDSAFVYLDIKPGRINIERYASVIVALIGLIGVIGAALINKGVIFPPESKLEDLVYFDVDNYGLNRDTRRFQAVLRWEKPPTHSSKLIESHMAWTFLRLRDNQDDIRASVVVNPKGPFPLKNGMSIEHEISDDMLTNYGRNRQWLQLVVVAMPRNMALSENARLSSYGDSAVILINPSVRPTP